MGIGRSQELAQPSSNSSVTATDVTAYVSPLSLSLWRARGAGILEVVSAARLLQLGLLLLLVAFALPAAGEVTIFDRSWYNRAGVERVMGFATEEEVEYFLKYTPSVEQSIIHSGIILIKYWLEVSMENQDFRLRARNEDGRKIWKLSPMDLKSYTHWYDYSRARDAMFAATDTEFAPWHIVRADIKKHARLNCITHLLSQFPYHEIPREEVKLGKRKATGEYNDKSPLSGRRFVPEVT